MDIQVFTLCEFAQTINGKTNIIGTFNHITPQAFPFVMPDFFVVIKLSFNHDFNDMLSITLREKEGPDLVSTGAQPITIKADHRDVIHDVVLRINQAVFRKPGEYEVVFKIGNEEHVTILYVDENRQ
mgnify:CR=1 FL=1